MAKFSKLEALIERIVALEKAPPPEPQEEPEEKEPTPPDPILLPDGYPPHWDTLDEEEKSCWERLTQEHVWERLSAERRADLQHKNVHRFKSAVKMLRIEAKLNRPGKINPITAPPDRPPNAWVEKAKEGITPITPDDSPPQSTEAEQDVQGAYARLGIARP